MKSEGDYEMLAEGKLLKENSGYVELMDINDHLEAIHYEWEKWKNGPETSIEDIGIARADILGYIQNYLRIALK